MHSGQVSVPAYSLMSVNEVDIQSGGVQHYLEAEGDTTLGDGQVPVAIDDAGKCQNTERSDQSHFGSWK